MLFAQFSRSGIETDWSWFCRRRCVSLRQCFFVDLILWSWADSSQGQVEWKRHTANDKTGQMWLYRNDCKHTEVQTVWHLELWIHNWRIIPDMIYFTDKAPLFYQSVFYDITHCDSCFERQSSIYETYEVRGVISFSLSAREILAKGLWWIDIIVSGWTSDSWLLCCVERAAVLSVSAAASLLSTVVL